MQCLFNGQSKAHKGTGTCDPYYFIWDQVPFSSRPFSGIHCFAIAATNAHFNISCGAQMFFRLPWMYETSQCLGTFYCVVDRSARRHSVVNALLYSWAFDDDELNTLNTHQQSSFMPPDHISGVVPQGTNCCLSCFTLVCLSSQFAF